MGLLTLIGRITLDGTQFKSGLKGIENSVKGTSDRMGKVLSSAFSGGLMGTIAGGLGLGAVFHFIDSKADEFKARMLQLKRGMALTGFDAETYQKLVNVFEAVGEGPEAVAKPLQTLAAALEKVRAGGPEAERTMLALSKVGLSLDQMMSGEAHAVFLSLFSGLKDAAKDAEKLAALKTIFGKDGALSLLPAAQAGLDSMAAEGGALDQAAIDRAKAMKQELEGGAAFMRDLGQGAREAGSEIMHAFKTQGAWAGRRLLNMLGFDTTDIEPQQQNALPEGWKVINGIQMNPHEQAVWASWQKRIADAKKAGVTGSIEGGADAARQAHQNAMDQLVGSNRAERIKELEEKLRLKDIGPEARGAEIDNELKALRARNEGFGVWNAADKERILQLELEKRGLPAKADAAKDTLSRFRPEADALSSIGNRLGEDPHSRAAVDNLRVMRETLQRIEKNTQTSRGQSRFPL